MGALNAEGGYAAADHLYNHGCRRIAFVGGFADSSARQERRGGVETFLAERDLSSPSRSPCRARRCAPSPASWP